MLFGDEEYEHGGQRAPSPWDGFMSTPPSEAGSLDVHKPLRSGVPKLAPEVEEVRHAESHRVTPPKQSLAAAHRATSSTS